MRQVALYARVSTKDGRQDTENQLPALRDYCSKQSWPIVDEYVDRETGGISNRPRFQRMFQDARQRKFDLVLFWSLDRFSREGALATMKHLERLSGYGVHWRSHTEEYLDSLGLFGEAVLAILATIAKQERLRRSERAAAAIARLKRQGKTDHLGRPSVLGPADRAKAKQLRDKEWSIRRIAAESASVLLPCIDYYRAVDNRKRGIRPCMQTGYPRPVVIRWDVINA